MHIRWLPCRISLAIGLAAFAAAAPAQNTRGGDERTHKDFVAAPQPARFVQDFEPTPAIWRLADDDTTIYLFGTIHLLPPGLKWRSPALNRIIDTANELVVESSDAEMEAIDGPLGKLMVEELLVKRPPLLDRVAPERRDALRRSIEASGLSPTMFDRMPTWMAVFALALGGAMEDGSTGEAGADSTLERLFVEAKKPVGSVEDPIAVVNAIRKIPDAELLRLLEEPTLATDDDAPVAADDIAWAKGNVADLETGLSEKELGAPLYAVLIRDRNRAWTGWLAERLKRPGTVLFAVGAGHLVGVDSLQTMLAERGLTAIRLP